jgi:hypothetical protein
MRYTVGASRAIIPPSSVGLRILPRLPPRRNVHSRSSRPNLTPIPMGAAYAGPGEKRPLGHAVDELCQRARPRVFQPGK